MKTIWKYRLTLEEHQGIRMPRNSNILDVQVQDGIIPVFWATVDTDTPMEERRFLVLYTDAEITGYPVYHGTFQIGPIEYHLFEEYDAIPF